MFIKYNGYQCCERNDGSGKFDFARRPSVDELVETSEGTWFVVVSIEERPHYELGYIYITELREATQAEVDEWNKPVTKEENDAFWNEFSDNTDYIR